jgi:hypothetical protein
METRTELLPSGYRKTPGSSDPSGGISAADEMMADFAKGSGGTTIGRSS